MKILIIDNYDSFTFNLYQMLGEILNSLKYKQIINEFELIVKRNNTVTLNDIKEINPDRILISPGPGNPSDEKYFGISKEVIVKLGKHIPILGICLGMQGLAYSFGADIVPAKIPMHGKISTITHNNHGVFKNLPQNIEIMRYHSLVIDNDTLPNCFEITAVIDNEIMGIKHKEFPLEGVQFHPESFASEAGKELLENFIFMH